MKFKKRRTVFGENLRYLRKEKRLKQSELGEMLNYGANTISGYETGKSTPDFNALLQLIEIFDIDADTLLFTPLYNGIALPAPAGKNELSYPASPDANELLKQQMDQLAKEVRDYAKLIREYKNDLYDLQQEVETIKAQQKRKRTSGKKKRTELPDKKK